MKQRGLFISFEGPEGSGKSTHLRLISERLQQQGLKVLTTREPGGTHIGELIRKILQRGIRGESPTPTTELLLFLACRAQLVDRAILPALEAGYWVLSDRFCDSTFAYQGAGRGMDVDVLRSLNDFATASTYPDLTLILDIPEAESRLRVVERGTLDRFESERSDFHHRVSVAFRKLATGPEKRFRYINSSGTIDDTQEAIWNVITDFLKERDHDA